MINVLERITHFRNLKGWTEYQLAEKSGLDNPQFLHGIVKTCSLPFLHQKKSCGF